MMSGADNERPAVGDPGKLGRGQPVAALEDFDKTPPERERSVRETCSAPNPRFHRLNPGEGNLNFRPPQYAEMPRARGKRNDRCPRNLRLMAACEIRSERVRGTRWKV